MDNIFETKLSAKYETIFINMMTTILKNNNILELFNNDMYIGGSLPSFVFSKLVKKEYNITTLACNDIDIYTSNYVTTLCAMNTHLKPTKIEKNGVNINVHIDSPTVSLLQFMLANIGSFKNENNHSAFLSEVLDNYDTSLVKLGYHPYTKTIIIHNDFINDFLKKKFYHKSIFPKQSVTIPKKTVCEPYTAVTKLGAANPKKAAFKSYTTVKKGIERFMTSDNEESLSESEDENYSDSENESNNKINISSDAHDIIVSARNKKIEYRARTWYDATIEQINDTKSNWTKDRGYNGGYVEIETVFDFKYKGSYLKRYHNK